jgi:hypothetical protein
MSGGESDVSPGRQEGFEPNKREDGSRETEVLQLKRFRSSGHKGERASEANVRTYNGR